MRFGVRCFLLAVIFCCYLIFDSLINFMKHHCAYNMYPAESTHKAFFRSITFHRNPSLFPPLCRPRFALIKYLLFNFTVIQYDTIRSDTLCGERIVCVCISIYLRYITHKKHIYSQTITNVLATGLKLLHTHVE